MSKEAIYNSATKSLEWAGKPTAVKVEPGTIGNSDLDFFDDFVKRQKANEKMKQNLLDSMHSRDVNSSSIEKEENIKIHEEKMTVPIQKNVNLDHGMIYISGKNEEVTKVVGEQQIMMDKSEKMKQDLRDFMHDRIEKAENKVIIHEEKTTTVPIQKYVETHVVQPDHKKGLIEKIKDKIPEKIKEKIPAHHRKEIRGILGKIKENIPSPRHHHHSKE